MFDAKSEIVEIDGTQFLLDPMGVWIPNDEDGPIIALRTKAMVERFQRLRDETSVQRIVELGIWQGGGAALLEAIFKPEVLVACELSSERAEPLDRYVADRGLEQKVLPHYGIDQSDRDSILRVVRAAVGTTPVDLVVDDASHLYEETKSSFCTLFPLLRPGGLFVIEDWATSIMVHDPDIPDYLQRALDKLESGAATPLSTLIGELVIAAASSDAIAEVEVSSTMVIVRRGEGELEPGFDLDQLRLAHVTDVFAYASSAQPTSEP